MLGWHSRCQQNRPWCTLPEIAKMFRVCFVRNIFPNYFWHTLNHFENHLHPKLHCFSGALNKCQIVIQTFTILTLLPKNCVLLDHMHLYDTAVKLNMLFAKDWHVILIYSAPINLLCIFLIKLHLWWYMTANSPCTTYRIHWYILWKVKVKHESSIKISKKTSQFHCLNINLEKCHLILFAWTYKKLLTNLFFCQIWQFQGSQQMEHVLESKMFPVLRSKISHPHILLYYLGY